MEREKEYARRLNALHIPDDAGEFTDALVAIMRRIPDGWGRWIGCSKGWYPIIIEVDHRLAELNPDYVVHQAKEKFGSLRYYYESSGAVNENVRRQMDEVVSAAELEAAITRETCGSRKDVALRRPQFPVQTLCAVCAERQGHNRFLPSDEA